MSYKRYEIKDRNKGICSFRLPDSSKVVEFKSITFGSKYQDGILSFETEDSAIQSGVENLKAFKNGVIRLVKEIKTDAEEPEVPETEETDFESGHETDAEVNQEQTGYEDVTSIQQVKEILRKEPFKIAPIALSDAKKVRAQAEKAGLHFPKVIWEA